MRFSGQEMVSKNHHYLPQFYLKQWANEKDQVWTYFKNRDPIQIKVRNIGSENYLYSIGRNDYLEQKWLAPIDGNLSTIFDEVRGRDLIDEKTILKLKAFLIISLARNPKTKKVSKMIMDFDATGTPKRNPFAQVLQFRTKVLAKEIEPLNVQILQIPDDLNFSFVTSNQPFFVVGKPENQFAENPVSEKLIQQSSIQICWMPLTPKYLIFYTSNEVINQVVKADSFEKLLNINKNLVLGADKYLIFNSDSLFIDQPELENLFNK
ncbi:MAG: DUF4238 domain-containing protein [Candidatus Methanofastidiosa archaeon]|nr:DUF4238 domain-containing protein [Candidatus Methanofastidiosa archaeon]